MSNYPGQSTGYIGIAGMGVLPMPSEEMKVASESTTIEAVAVGPKSRYNLMVDKLTETNVLPNKTNPFEIPTKFKKCNDSRISKDQFIEAMSTSRKCGITEMKLKGSDISGLKDNSGPMSFNVAIPEDCGSNDPYYKTKFKAQNRPPDSINPERTQIDKEEYNKNGYQYRFGEQGQASAKNQVGTIPLLQKSPITIFPNGMPGGFLAANSGHNAGLRGWNQQRGGYNGAKGAQETN
jgi:hypothetical protein